MGKTNKTKKFILIFHVIGIFFISYNITFSQCTCMGGAAVGGLTPVSGTVNVGVLREGFFRVSSFYRYSEGNDYLRGDIPAEKGPVNNYSMHYIGLLAGYGISTKLTLEAELGYFPMKYQDFNEFEIKGYGLSHCLLSGKYNLFHSIANEFEITLGIGGRIPLIISEDNLPQHLLPSSGAYGLVTQFFIHKGFRKEGLRFILLQRADINAKNELDFKYGTGFYTSFYTTKLITNSLTGIFEIRNEYRLQDKYQDRILEDSGGIIVILSPQINYAIGEFSISALFDYPVYKYYYGHQLSSNVSFAFNITWQKKLL